MKRTTLIALFGIASVWGSAHAGTPITIGGSFDLSGPAAEVGKDSLLGTQYAVEVLNKRGGVLGQPVVLNYQDNGTNPQRASNQAASLVHGGAVMLMAPQSSADTLAVSKTVSAKLKVPMCVSASGSEDITMKSFQPYVFSIAVNGYFQTRAMATRLAKMPYKRYAVVAADYAGARTNAARFMELMKEMNPNVEFVIEEYPKLGAIDYTAAINKILAAKPDYVFTSLYGSDLVTFSKQATAVGFFKQIDNRFIALYDESTLKSLGQFAAIGSDGGQFVPASYLATASPQSKLYVNQFKAKYGVVPSDWTTSAYECVMIWAQAATAAKTTDADAVMHAVESSDFKVIRGTLRFAKYDHQADTPMFIGRVDYSKELKQPVMTITDVIPGATLQPSESVVMKARQSQ
ncbi:ABC transporter substrate-binding protein [Paraburkholderia sp. D1E]|uniref:ABC transporter substrate-binding protein n=1 Tax=Paraburkholderia sp. D1E TaxID=3461398 RepID=UPI00404636AC